MSKLAQGNVTATIRDGALGAVRCSGVEVLRALTYPVRNADWGTHLVLTEAETLEPARYIRRFRDMEGVFSGEFRVTLAAPLIEAEVRFTFAKAARVNRAGFTLLHPIRGVAGQALTVRHPHGLATETVFPALISPDQPARDIVGLTYILDGIQVAISMEGDTFEMEDQRNWSDASYKTYCRPLALPRPYTVAPGETVWQRIMLSVEAAKVSTLRPPREPQRAMRLPQVMLAHETGISDLAALKDFPGVPVQLRLTDRTPDDDLRTLAARPGTALEIVFDDLAGLDRLIARAKAAGLRPSRVSALPQAYLQSHQPEGPWPAGPTPADALAPLRQAFPQTPVGGGSLTNFTELNRCRPDPATVDFVTFGNTAIVHAADDLSVWQTLEALPDIFASASRIAAGKPLHLGLLSIGMRSNPYGAAVAANPDRLCLPMAMDDPRQGTGFAAAYALAALACAAEAGVQSLALAMTGGPLGARGPLADVLRAASGLAGADIRLARSEGVVTISAQGALLAANCTPEWRNAPDLPPESATLHLQ